MGGQSSFVTRWCNIICFRGGGGGTQWFSDQSQVINSGSGSRTGKRSHELAVHKNSDLALGGQRRISGVHVRHPAKSSLAGVVIRTP